MLMTCELQLGKWELDLSWVFLSVNAEVVLALDVVPIDENLADQRESGAGGGERAAGQHVKEEPEPWRNCTILRQGESLSSTFQSLDNRSEIPGVASRFWRR